MTIDIAQVRQQFPSLHQADATTGHVPIFLDNPAGTQVPQRVIDAVVDYYTSSNANLGGQFPHSARTETVLYAAREAMADMLNAPRPEEIVFNMNMTTLNFALSRSLAVSRFSAGDELVLTRMDHDANVSPWLAIAHDHDLTVRWVDINTDDGTLDMDSLEAAITEKTRLVATVHASNALGTINPVQQIAGMAHAADALYVMDAVQSAPHVPIDVQEIGCDFLLCSAYKFFGPHIGILWGRYDLLDTLPAYKVRPAKDEPPSRWETGTLSFETIAGVTEAVNYLASLGEIGDFQGYSGRRAQLKRAIANVNAYERPLMERLLAGLTAMPRVTVAGLTDESQFDQRVATVSFVVEGQPPAAVVEHLAQHNIQARSGDYYATEAMASLGRADEGMVRVGVVHYNTLEEVETLLSVLDGLA